MTADQRDLVFCSKDQPRLFDGVSYVRELWHVDPFDVESIHANARIVFHGLVDETLEQASGGRSSILLLKGKAGSGKTHLLRAFRAHLHSNDLGYLGYMQMTSAAKNYSLYILRNLVDSLNEPYWESSNPKQTCLQKLIFDLTSELEQVPGRLIEELSDEKTRRSAATTASNHLLRIPRLSKLDPELLGVLLYLIPDEPPIQSRVFKYLRNEPLSEHDRLLLGGIPARGEDSQAAQQTLKQLALLVRSMSAERPRALVICVDQFEDFFEDDETTQRQFRDAMGTVRTLSEAMPGTIFILSMLEDYYERLSPHMQTSVRDRIEHDPEPVLLSDVRTRVEIEEMVRCRLAFLYRSAGLHVAPSDCVHPFRQDDLAALENLNSRRVLEACGAARQESIRTGKPPRVAQGPGPKPNIHDRAITLLELAWNDFVTNFNSPLPDDEEQQLRLLRSGLEWAAQEHGMLPELAILKGHGTEHLRVSLGAPDGALKVALCNRSPKGNGLLNQIDALVAGSKEGLRVAVRKGPFPSSAGTQIFTRLTRFQSKGGHCVTFTPTDWQGVAAMDEFRSERAGKPEFVEWIARERPLSELPGLSQVLKILRRANRLQTDDISLTKSPEPETKSPEPDQKDGGAAKGKGSSPAEHAAPKAKSISAKSSAIRIGIRRSIGAKDAFEVPAQQFAKHACFLGAPGSGKTTLAQNVLEQLLAKGVPTILVDRKGDLSSYADALAWDTALPSPELRSRRDDLRGSVDISLFTPGEASGRPLSIPILPAGAGNASDGNLDQLATFAAYAVGRMRGWSPGGANDNKLAVLKSAIRLLAQEESEQPVTLARLVDFIASANPADLSATIGAKVLGHVAEGLDAMRTLNSQLFTEEAPGLDSSLFLKPAHSGRTRLSIINTSFLSDAAATFWLAQMLLVLDRHLRGLGTPEDGIRGVIFFDEADIYIPSANVKVPATKEPLAKALMQWRAFGMGIFLATQNPANLDYRARDQISNWYIGKIQTGPSINWLEPLWAGSNGSFGNALPKQGPGEFIAIGEVPTRTVQPVKADLSLIRAQPISQQDALRFSRSSR